MWLGGIQFRSNGQTLFSTILFSRGFRMPLVDQRAISHFALAVKFTEVPNVFPECFEIIRNSSRTLN